MQNDENGTAGTPAAGAPTDAATAGAPTAQSAADMPATQEERALWLINYLRKDPACAYAGGNLVEVPPDAEGRRLLLRALFNVRMPEPVSDAFLQVQDAYLAGRREEKGVTRLSELSPVSAAEPDLYLWRGDITTLATDAIVNAANSQMLGCFQPNHGCIDNAIHTYAGVQLRLECARLMRAQGHDEPTGAAKVTPAYNLPSRWVVHTVGPIVQGAHPTAQNRYALASCYTSCLAAARDVGARSIAFCCISTGVFGYPNQEAARVATDTVRSWKEKTGSGIKVVFNVFKPVDEHIYLELLRRGC